ncbi:hypothetical protein [Arenimonas sp.]|uniref:hypothetical protein n=1 Tax=Arenimonas sp. TaxID=1872635 RepID=UPI0039E2493C
MTRRALPCLLLLLCLPLAACGGGSDKEADAGMPDQAAQITQFPAVVEGEFIVDVAEGDTDDEGVSDFNFGTLVVDGKQMHVDVDGAVLASIGITGDEAVRVRATLGSSRDEYGLVTYKVTAMEKL